MAEFESPYCPECDEAFHFPEPPPIDRRGFIRVIGGAAASLALGATGARAAFAEEAKAEKKPKPAEELVKELFAGLDADQKKSVLLPFDHGQTATKRATRLGMYNEPILKIRIGKVYTKGQQELIERIVKSLSSGEDGYRQISRMGRWDNSGALENCGALFFGEPTPGNKYAFVFAGHHLTIRCDGDFEDGTAFGGPIYYGHSPNGWSRGNVFNFQTRSVVSVFKALDGKQRDKAVVAKGNPGEQAPSVQFKDKPSDRPGIPYTELSKDQQALVETVMRTVLSPYRAEDVDEVMGIIKKNGGMEKIQLAFYPDGNTDDKEPWHFWRLEGPGFVWNYRVLPHVHTYVNCCLQS